MNLTFDSEMAINDVISAIEKQISAAIRISYIESNKPWGGYFVINQDDTELFIYQFFPELDKVSIGKGKLSPKILVIAPGKKLSWQYHNRRAELWKVIGGKIGVITSESDIESDKKMLKVGEIITINERERHRIIGLNDWGVVAEIWIHTDSHRPSDEEDIIRLKDDFNR